MNLQAFIEKNSKGKSVFEKFREDIFQMVENNVSQRSIITYLKSKTRKKNGLTQPNLNQWLKRQESGACKKIIPKVDFFASKPSAEHHSFSSVPSQENNHEKGDSYRIKVAHGRSKVLG